MKYKDFKQLTDEDLKQIVGGTAPGGGCSTKCVCEGSGEIEIAIVCMQGPCETVPGQFVRCLVSGSINTCADNCFS